MKRISFFGIDGSGKTTAMKNLQASADGSAAFLFSPDFHEIADFPGAAESRALSAISSLADTHQDLGLKMATLYLRMCLFSDAERYLLARGPVRTLCIERHPLVDSLAYLPVYARVAKQAGARPSSSDAVLERIAAQHPVLAGYFYGALERRNARLGAPLKSVDALARYCLAFAGLSTPDRARALAREFETSLPQVVVHLDIGADAALARLVARGKVLEVHETRAQLELLNQTARARLIELGPLGVAVESVRVDGLSEAGLHAALSHHLQARAA